MYSSWCYNEFEQVGKDYGKAEEVERYDRSHRDFRDVAEENRFTIDLLELASSSTVIDIGCGTGAFCIAAAQAGTKVIGLDVSEAMLRAASESARRAGVSDSVRFVRGGFLSYEHQGERVDAVVTSLCLHHLPDFWKAVALERIRKVLKPEGTLFVRDVVLPDQGSVEAIDRFVVDQAAAGGSFLREDAEQHFREEFSTFDWVMKGLFERSGFRVTWENVEREVIRSYICKLDTPSSEFVDPVA